MGEAKRKESPTGGDSGSWEGQVFCGDEERETRREGGQREGEREKQAES